MLPFTSERVLRLKEAWSSKDENAFNTAIETIERDLKECEAKRDFLHLRPRCWKAKDPEEGGKLLKVLPWFAPLNDEGRIDLIGLMKELAPEIMTDDVMGNYKVYSGLVMQLGWMVENQNGVWLGLVGVEMKDLFEDLGLWDTALHGKPAEPETPA